MVKRVILALALAVAGLVAFNAPGAHAATAGLVNGGFETGNLSGWTTSTTGGGGPPFVTTGFNGYIPTEGSYFAVVPGGCSTNSIQQSFSAVAGETLSGNAAFTAGDYLPFNDNGQVTIQQGNVVLFYRDVSQVGNGGSSPWTRWSWTAPSTGTYTVVASSSNSGDCSVASDLLLDAVTLALPTAKTPCRNNVCPSAQAKFNTNGVSGSFKVVEGTNGALSGSIQYSDSANPTANIPGCYTGSPSCNFVVSSFTCSGKTAQVYGTATVNGVVRTIHLALSGSATSTGTVTVDEAWTGGTYSKTASGYGIVSVVCP